MKRPKLPRLKFPRPRLPKPSLPLPKFQVPGISPALGLGEKLFGKVIGLANESYGLVRSTIGGLPLLGKNARSKSYEHQKFDEKHYFLIPDLDDPEEFSFYVMRCLPDGVPPINELPKRRILHLPSEHAVPQLEAAVLAEASEAIRDNPREPGYLSSNLNALLDEVDKIDDAAFKGLLAVGGLVALINPLAGAAVAAKAALPALGMVLGKYGMKMASDTMTNMDIARQIKKAKKDIKKQFSESSNLQVINPILANLGRSIELESWLMEKQRFSFECDDVEFTQADLIRLMDLTIEAIVDLTGEPPSDDYVKQIRELVLWS